MISFNHYESSSRALIISLAAAPLAVLAPARWSSKSTSRSWKARRWPARTPRSPQVSAQHIPLDNLAPCSASQLTSDAHYGNALSSGWLSDQPDVIAADYLYQDLGYRHVTVLATDCALGVVNG